ncbi:MAG: DUF4331 family protein [Candidatus Andersenbacteria bacterium]
MEFLMTTHHPLIRAARTTAAVLAVAAVACALPTRAHEGQHIKDVFAFTSQEDSDRLVLTLTLDDAATFDDHALYEFKIDSNADGVEDKVVQATFAGSGQDQTVTIHGPAVPEVTGGHGKVLRGATLSGNVSLADNPEVLAQPGYPVRAFAGLRDDPSDKTGRNVLAIVVEVRKDAVVAEGVSTVDVWATISTP